MPIWLCWWFSLLQIQQLRRNLVFEICIRRQAQPEQILLSFLSFCLRKFVKINVKSIPNRLELPNLPNQKVRNETMGTKKDNSIKEDLKMYFTCFWNLSTLFKLFIRKSILLKLQHGAKKEQFKHLIPAYSSCNMNRLKEEWDKLSDRKTIRHTEPQSPIVGEVLSRTLFYPQCISTAVQFWTEAPQKLVLLNLNQSSLKPTL